MHPLDNPVWWALTGPQAHFCDATPSVPAAQRFQPSFLHVLTTNDRARSLYERLGFRHRTLMQISAFVAPD